MSMVNRDTYTLTVDWGKYNILNDDGTAYELTWCWHGIATHISNTTPTPTAPTNWNDITPTNARSETIETYAKTWSNMSANIALLTTFWDE